MKGFKKALATVLVATTLLTAIPVEGVVAQEVTVTNTEEQVTSSDSGASEQTETDLGAGSAENPEGTGSTGSTENSDSTGSTDTSEGTGSTEDAEISEGTGSTENSEGTGSTEISEGTGSMENSEGTGSAEDSTVTGSTEKESGTEELEDGAEAVEGEELEEDSEEIEEEYLIQYLMVNESNVSLGTSQQVVVSIGCDKVIEEAVLQYHNQNTGEVFQQYFTEVTDNAILFEILFDNINQTGTYQLDSVTFYVEDEEYTEYFAEADIEAVFGVNQEVEAEPDAVIDDGTTEEAVDIDVVTIDENGNTTSETTMEEAINNASASQVMTLGLDDEVSAYSVSRSSNIVVVLDPGHDNTHAGAQAYGLGEEDLNLKIAMYCKAELEEYQGVTVYMTRSTDGSCPYPGTTAGTCNTNRVAFAKSVGANVYVSLHNNSASSTSASGAMVFYPNANYNPWVSATGQGLAQMIENQLVALGLYNRGITIRDAQEDKYPDGSAADYYGVIRNSKLQGIPAIIVEHAFMTNAGDVNNFLVSEDKLKALGVADATGIASYYGLSKQENITVTSGKVTVSSVNNSAGTATISVSSVEPSSKISKVSFAVWSKSDQSDLVWYNVTNNGTGTYQATLNIAKHQYNVGTYYIDAYAYDIYGKTHYIGGNSCTFSLPKAQITATGNSTQTVYTIAASGVVVPGGVKNVKYAVWSATGGNDDLIWYTATVNSSGNYVASVPISSHKTSGRYYVDAYAVSTNGASTYIGGTTFNVDEISGGTVSVTNINYETGQFDVVISGISSVSGIGQIQVPVWIKSDRTALHWYRAEKQANGNYVAHIDIANHGYAYTEYQFDVYGIAGNGIQKYIGGKSVQMSIPRVNVSASGNATETNYVLNIPELRMAGTPQNVKLAVWSVNGGQDDLIWYKADATGLAGWRVNVPITNHKDSGVYYVHAYVTDASGRSSYVGGTRFSVSEVSMQKIQVANKNEGDGQFDLILTGMTSKSGFSRVQVPVWTRENPSDIHWYTAELQSDGTYRVHVDLANHNYDYGTYCADVYATSGNGIYKYLGGTKVTMKRPEATLKATGNSTETTYRITISNASMAGGIKSMSFAVWSKVGGGTDLKWYNATKVSNGTWVVDVPITNHKNSGLYYVDAYAKNAANESVYMASTSFKVSPIQSGTVTISNVNEGTGRFDIIISGISAKAGISQVRVPVWSKPDQSDLHWYTATKQSDGSYVVNVSISNHNYNYGKYYADVYATAGNGIYQYVGGKTVTMNVPKAQITATANSNQTKFSLMASNVGIAGGVKSVRFAVWSQANGSDDLIWYNATNTIPGTWTVDMTVANHHTAGVYCVDAYAQSVAGTSVYLGGTTFKVSSPTVSSVKLVNYNEANGTFGVQVAGVQSTAGISSVKVAVWSASNQSDLVWYDATATGSGTYQIGADVRNHQNNTGIYYADAYVTDNNGIRVYAGGITCSMVNVTNVFHPIMGSTSVTVKQMADYYKSVAYYPSFYANTEAPTIEAFCKIYLEECQAEGVKAEVAFCQAMKETGFLRFGGNVSITQFNFAGLGSTGAGVAGETYPDIRTGIRAQIQHLKAYGCGDPLNQACVDTRFKYVSRNTAPYVEWLGIQENPYGKGWATAKNYGYDIVRMINTLKTY